MKSLAVRAVRGLQAMLSFLGELVACAMLDEYELIVHGTREQDATDNKTPAAE